MRKHPPVEREKELKIIEFFKTQHDNRTIVIAEKFDVQIHQVEKIINDFLKPKTPKIY
jgi:hypothetical protein